MQATGRDCEILYLHVFACYVFGMAAPYTEKVSGNLSVVPDASGHGGVVSAVALSLSGKSTNSSIQVGITAHAGGGQGSAVALTKKVNVISTVGTAADSVLLPAATGSGSEVIVINNAAANSLNVFPAGTDVIDAGSASAADAVAAGKRRIYLDVAAGVWASLLGA